MFPLFHLNAYGKMVGEYPLNRHLKNKIEGQIKEILDCEIILHRRFLDDERLSKVEQEKVLAEIFNENVRQIEIQELSRHFSSVIKNGECLPPLGVYGNTGIGKSITIYYFFQIFQSLCQDKNIQFKVIHLDLCTPRPCFRVLNDFACLLGVSKRYERGISLDEFMGKIEKGLKSYRGYLALFIDEIDNVKRDQQDIFLKFLVKRLPKAVNTKIILVLVSNKINWTENIDPRIKSVLKMKELIFAPYNADDLVKILNIRVKKALDESKLKEGVIEKIAAIASQDHGDARKAVELLTLSAELAEIKKKSIDLNIIDMAHAKLEREKYVTMIKNSPKQLQLALYSVLIGKYVTKQYTGDIYKNYLNLCDKIKMRTLTQRAFSDLISELDLYSFIRCRIISKGRHGRYREIYVELSDNVVSKIKEVIERNLEF